MLEESWLLFQVREACQMKVGKLAEIAALVLTSLKLLWIYI